MRKKRLAVLITVFLLLAAVLLGRVQAESDFFSEIKLIIQVYQIIKSEYIEKVEPSRLIEGAIRGMVKVLNDPYSRWLNTEEWEEWNVEREGKFGGLGMVVGLRDGFITIIDPLEDTPASRAGLQPGDRIIKINGESTRGMSLDEAVNKIRGEVGTQVTITIEREGVTEPLEYTLTRTLIRLPNIDKRVLEDNIGYLKIMGFTDEHTSKQVKDALLFLKKMGIRSLILDLRDNPGGLLSQAVEVADEFLSSGTIVSIKGRDVEKNEIYSAKPGGEGIDFPLVVLINRGSASGSEIVAGAIKDHKRGILLGTPTFGKGTVQNAIPLENRGALWLTTARYYTPSGICIEGEGIKPNLEVKPFTPTPEQKEIMNKVRTSPLVKDFLDLKPQWEKEDLSPLLKELEKENLKIDEDLLKRILREKDADKENDIFNDNQLVQALNLLKSLAILQ
ncbi:peptidase S41 [Candidatus Aerophobetes bacterium]|uniref:Peptidase S41 n=1 Tax=Aerophobetes bacterium TaxID=2030807 RepID=A0A662DDN7_UNCAE|nr:MAG: peptidase S41 [Candidatus Aerophobetes bacterium]